MHEYDHHIGDYTRDTVGLAMIEDGAYRRLLDQCYASELPLPKEKREVYRMARASLPAERKAVDYVLGRYFVLRDDGWHQNRVDREVARHHERSDQAKAAAVERWERQRERERQHATADATAYPTADAEASPEQGLSNASCAGAGGTRGRAPPSAFRLPPSELQNRDVGVDPPSTLTASTDNGKVNGAVLKVATSKAETEGAGQRWSHPNYVAATAQTLGIKRRENEGDEAFKDRVYDAVKRRRGGAQA